MSARGAAADRTARFEVLYRSTRTDVLGYLLRRTAQAEDAADLLGEVYLTAWRRIDDLPAGDAARLWLFGTARHALANSYRKSETHRHLADRLRVELHASGMGRAGPDLTSERDAALHDALAGMEPDARELLTLTAWEQLAPHEIAQITGDTPGSVRVRLHRARVQLRLQLDRRGGSGARGRDVVEAQTRLHDEPEAAAPGLLDADRRLLFVEPALQQE